MPMARGARRRTGAATRALPGDITLRIQGTVAPVDVHADARGPRGGSMALACHAAPAARKGWLMRIARVFRYATGCGRNSGRGARQRPLEGQHA
jgi:hypothetical protein